MIICAKPLAQYEALSKEIDDAIKRVLKGGRYILGPELTAFEEEFAAYNGVAHAVGVANGTDALQIALAALNVGSGDEVITVSHTAVATSSAIVQVGAIPVFVDVHPDSYTIDCAQLESALTKKTKAIIPVHIYGHPCDMDSILAFAKKHKLFVIEDCAQAHGAAYRGKRVGSMGDIGCFSFYPTKNLGAIGDGGCIISNGAVLAERAKLLRQYGWAERYISAIHGWNSRLDELQAAILRVKLPRLDADNAYRNKLAKIYNNYLSKTPVKLPQAATDMGHVYHLYAIRAERRDELKQYLEKKNIHPLVHYPMPIHLQPGYAHFSPKNRSLAVTEQLACTELSLPLYPGLEESAVEFVGKSIQDFFS